jgi:hypothetical protein
MMKRFAMTIAASLIGVTIGVAISIPAYAASKVDCDAVMSEINSGKTTKAVAADLKISASSVYKCKKKAKAAAKAAGESAIPAAEASPAAPPAAAPKKP